MNGRRSLSTPFAGLERTIVNIGWMLVIVFASILFAVPNSVTAVLMVAVRIYAVLAVGLIVIRFDRRDRRDLDSFVHRYAERRDWQRIDHLLAALLPTFRACLEYALWVGVGSLALAQLAPMQGLAGRGAAAGDPVLPFSLPGGPHRGGPPRGRPSHAAG